jgi:UDP:flavonoid glycosyltransferase YjiC (YdhE family)
LHAYSQLPDTERGYEEAFMHRQPTVAVFPEPGAWGPTNNLVAMADHLREHGIRVVFLVEESFRGELEKRDFEESVLRMTPPPEHEEDVGEGWAEFVRAIAPEFRKPTIEQLETVTRPFWVELVAGAKYAHERLMAIWDEVRPDVIVSDNVTGFPAVPLRETNGSDLVAMKAAIGNARVSAKTEYAVQSEGGY